MVAAKQLERLTSHPPFERPNPEMVEPLAKKHLASKKRNFDEPSSAPRKPPWRAKKQAQRSPLKDWSVNIIPKCYRYAAHSYSPGLKRSRSPDGTPRQEGERGRSRTRWPATATFQVLENHDCEENSQQSLSLHLPFRTRLHSTRSSRAVLEARQQQKPESSSPYNTSAKVEDQYPLSRFGS